MTISARLVLLPFLVSAGACSRFPTEAVCRDPERADPLPAGIFVMTRDSITGQNVAGAKVVARQSATVADSVISASASGAWVGKADGTYTVTVTRDGYQTWSRANVDVNSDVCGFIAVQLTALLQPQ